MPAHVRNLRRKNKIHTRGCPVPNRVRIAHYLQTDTRKDRKGPLQLTRWIRQLKAALEAYYA